MHYRLETQDFLDALSVLEQRLARVQARHERRRADGPTGRVDCRQADRFNGAPDVVPSERPSHDLPH